MRMNDQVLPFGLATLLFSQGKAQSGDAVTGASTLKTFASTATIKGGTAAPGDMSIILTAGNYENPTGAVNPTANPMVYFNETMVAQAGAQSAGVGTGVAHPFVGIVLVSVTDMGKCNIYGLFAFEGVNSVVAVAIFGQDDVAVDFTKDIAVSARVITNAAGNGATFRMRVLSVLTVPKV